MFRQTPHRPTLASLSQPLPDSWCMRNEGPGRVWWRMPQPASRHSLHGNGCKAAFFFLSPSWTGLQKPNNNACHPLGDSWAHPLSRPLCRAPRSHRGEEK